jgi:hypothetical protein
MNRTHVQQYRDNMEPAGDPGHNRGQAVGGGRQGMAGDKHPFWEVVVGLIWEVWGNVVEDKHPFWEVVVGLIWEVWGNVVEDKQSFWEVVVGLIW